jgi:TatD DNase family protein
MVDTELFFNIHTHNIRFPQNEIKQFSLNTEGDLPLLFSIGIHPENAVSKTQIIESQLEELANKSNCVAIGEIGLDNRYENAGEVQEQIFISQLQLAEKLQKPVILHCVNSWDRCRFLHQTHAPNTKLIYHGFNKAAITDQVLNYENTQISIGSSILNNTQLQEKVRTIPVSRILIETDDSEIPIELIYQKLAEIKSLNLRDFSEQIRENVKLIFGI